MESRGKVNSQWMLILPVSQIYYCCSIVQYIRKLREEWQMNVCFNWVTSNGIDQTCPSAKKIQDVYVL